MYGWDTSEFTKVGGTRMHAGVAGPPLGRQVVCVHGLACSHRYFGPLAKHLARRGVRVSCPDQPGFGRTRGPRKALDVRGLSHALADWIRATGREGALLFANSSGCQVAVDLAVHSPELLGPVILNGPTTDSHARSYLKQIVRLAVNVPMERPTLPLVINRDYLDAGPRRVLATFRHFVNDRMEEKLHHVHTPTLVLRGSRDPIAPSRWVHEVAEKLPHGRVLEVPRAAHTLNFSAPRVTAAMTVDFLNDPAFRI